MNPIRIITNQLFQTGNNRDTVCIVIVDYILSGNVNTLDGLYEESKISKDLLCDALQELYELKMIQLFEDYSFELRPDDFFLILKEGICGMLKEYNSTNVVLVKYQCLKCEAVFSSDEKLIPEIIPDAYKHLQHILICDECKDGRVISVDYVESKSFYEKNSLMLMLNWIEYYFKNK